MSKKHAFRSVSVKKVSPVALRERLGERIVVSIDVAKEKQFARFEDDAGTRETTTIVSWKHPEETPAFFEVCTALVAAGVKVEAAMEPSGTYGESLRYGLQQRSVDVYRVSGKHVHDSREVFDGVPSLHDAKSTGVIGWLHRQGRSTLWPAESEQQRELAARTNMVMIHESAKGRNLNRLEALLGAHWPEVQTWLDLSRPTLWALLATIGGPQQVASNAEQAKALLARVSRGKLAAAKIELIVASAHTTVGKPATPAEVAYLQHLAKEIDRDERYAREVRRTLKPAVNAAFGPELVALLGVAVCAVLLAKRLDPRCFPSAKAFEKALGLNLVEKSSGHVTGRKHISKRGSSQARQLMFMAALRLIRTDPVVKAWASVRTAAGPKRGICVMVAVLRKLARAAWRVSRGEPFDSTKLFDVHRLCKRGALPPQWAQRDPAPPKQPPPSQRAETDDAVARQTDPRAA